MKINTPQNAGDWHAKDVERTENKKSEQIDHPYRQDDPLRCADRDSYEAIYSGGDSSPFPY